MVTLREGQYELDGYLWGLGTPTLVMQEGDVTGDAQVRNQDVTHPRADQLLMGRDYITPTTRSFLLMIDTPDAVAELQRLRAAWRADRKRTSPLATSTLRWCRDGRTYRGYGRPRNFAVVHRDPPAPDRRYVQAQWQYADAIVYDDEADSLTLDLVSAPLGTSLVLPAVLPWTLGRISRARDGMATVGGLAAVPFQVVIHGPVTGAATDLVLFGPGWRLDFAGLTLPAGQQLNVDTSGVGSARIGTTSVAGSLTRSSTLTGRLQPGTAEFRFAATDPTATCTATISWRPAALII